MSADIPAGTRAPAPDLHVTLGDISGALGASLLRVLCAPRGTALAVSEAEILDPASPAIEARAGIMLGIGIRPGSADLGDALRLCAAHNAVGLVIKLRGQEPGESVRMAEASGVALLATDDRASWRHLDAMLTAVVNSPAGSAPSGSPDAEFGDLFSLANAVAASVGGAVAIIDPQHRILAYSTLPGQEIDDARREEILGRVVPEAFRAAHSNPRVLRGERPVRVSISGSMDRLAVAVKAGPELLGTMWVLDPGGSALSADAEATLGGAAAVAALHLLRHRSAHDITRRAREEALRALLDGHVSADVRERFEGSEQGWAIVAFEPTQQLTGPTGAELIELVASYAQVRHSQSSTVQLGGAVYTLLPVDAAARAGGAASFASAVLDRARDLLGVRMRAGLGCHATRLEQVRRSRAAADDVLRVLAERGKLSGFADFGDVHAASLLLRLRTLLKDDEEFRSPELEAMVRHDERNSTRYTATVLALLEHLGDSTSAARALFVHPNTFRYRVRRAVELFGLDLADPDAILLLWLAMRLERNAATARRA